MLLSRCISEYEDGLDERVARELRNFSTLLKFVLRSTENVIAPISKNFLCNCTISDSSRSTMAAGSIYDAGIYNMLTFIGPPFLDSAMTG